MGLLWSADNHLSNFFRAALRAMTGHEGESEVILFVIFPELLMLCGAWIIRYPNNFLISPLVDRLIIYSTII